MNAYVSAYACTALEPYVNPVRCYSYTTREVQLVFGNDRLPAVGRGRGRSSVILPAVVFLPVVFSLSLKETDERVQERGRERERERERRDDLLLINFVITGRKLLRRAAMYMCKLMFTTTTTASLK